MQEPIRNLTMTPTLRSSHDVDYVCVTSRMSDVNERVPATNNHFLFSISCELLFTCFVQWFIAYLCKIYSCSPYSSCLIILYIRQSLCSVEKLVISYADRTLLPQVWPVYKQQYYMIHFAAVYNRLPAFLSLFPFVLASNMSLRISYRIQ